MFLCLREWDRAEVSARFIDGSVDHIIDDGVLPALNVNFNGV